MAAPKKPHIWTKEERKAHSRLLRGKRGGDKSNFWKGGKTVWYRAIKNSYEYREFRRIVLERDGNKCVLCDSSEGLCVDHVKPFSLYPNLRTDPSNGRTLCKKCHYKTRTFGRNVPREYCPNCTCVNCTNARTNLDT